MLSGFLELAARLSKTVPSIRCGLLTVGLGKVETTGCGSWDGGDGSTRLKVFARGRVHAPGTAGRGRHPRAAGRDPHAGAVEGQGARAEPAVPFAPPVDRAEPADLRE